jgi:hypothetical protein
MYLLNSKEENVNLLMIILVISNNIIESFDSPFIKVINRIFTLQTFWRGSVFTFLDFLMLMVDN